MGNQEVISAVSQSAEQYTENFAAKIEQALKLHPFTETWGVTNQQVKSAFALAGLFAILNAARKNKAIVLGVGAAAYIYASNTKKFKEELNKAI